MVTSRGANGIRPQYRQVGCTSGIKAQYQWSRYVVQMVLDPNTVKLGVRAVLGPNTEVYDAQNQFKM